MSYDVLLLVPTMLVPVVLLWDLHQHLKHDTLFRDVSRTDHDDH